LSKKKYPKHPKDEVMNKDWSIAPLASVGVSAAVGVSLAIFDLTNRKTHRSHKFVIKAATVGISVKAGKLDDYKDLISQGAGQLSDEEYTNFRTEKDANFDTFDGSSGRITSFSAIIYSKTWLTLYDGTSLLARVNMSGFGLAFPGADSGAVLSSEVIYGNGRPLGSPDLLIDDMPLPIEETSIRSYSTEKDDSILVVFPAKLLFEFNEYDLRKEAIPLLRNLATYIRSKPASAYPRIYIVGHTDSKGSHQYNDGLSAQRAKTVHDILQATIPSNEFFDRTWVPQGRGKRSPISPNTKNGVDNAEGRSQNRRVEVLLLSPNAPIPRL
jgi:outer membrane protein OmpA-like peptidoglycan-associated protein